MLNKTEISDVEVLRSLDLVIDSWQNDGLSVDDMANQIEAVNSVAEGKSTFQDFVSETRSPKQRET